VNIIQDFIAPGRRHRPVTYPPSSLYKKKMVPKYITIHNAYSKASAKNLHTYLKGTGAESRPASWHFTVDEKEIYQALPLDESGWHAGDNLGPGNTTTIGIEICDYAMLLSPRNEPLYLQAEDHAAKLCAHLIKTVPSLASFPDCLKQHYDWSGKNCPSWIRARQNGWTQFIARVQGHLMAQPTYPPLPIPKIQRTIGVEVDGKKTNEVAYLINNATYVRMAYIMELEIGPLRVTGHGDHIKLRRGG